MNNQAERWKRLESKEIADCRIFKVREDLSENGDKKGTFYVLECPDWVNVVALTKSNEIVLIEQFRHGLENTILEIPGGMIDEAETPETAARRELLEETGYSSARWVLLGQTHPNPAIQKNRLFHFLALDCEKIGETSFDEHENVVTKLCPLIDVPRLIEEGWITHSLVLAAFQLFGLKFFKIK